MFFPFDDEISCDYTQFTHALLTGAFYIWGTFKRISPMPTFLFQKEPTMKTKPTLLFLFSLLSLVLAQVMPGRAQTEPPPAPPQADAEGRMFMPPDHLAAPQATGGPDEFGYTWDDSAPYGWLDATDGQLLGQGWACAWDLPLPFAFPYYENSYTTFSVSPQGYLSFAPFPDVNVCSWSSPKAFPATGSYVNLLAPLWSDFTNTPPGDSGRIFYKTGGTAPNRYAVVEWYQMYQAYTPYEGDTIFTFEVVLHENGNFTFQYETMDWAGGYWCDFVSLGMNDARGLDGLNYLDDCDEMPPSYTAVSFIRPVDRARVFVPTPYQGTFAQGNELVSFPIKLINTGTLGTDTYNLMAYTTWPLHLYAADGTALTDTDSNGQVDTGPVAQGATVTFQAEFQVPLVVNPNETNALFFSVNSVNDPAFSKNLGLDVTIPLPFAQIFSSPTYPDATFTHRLVIPWQDTALSQTMEAYQLPLSASLVEKPGGGFVSAWNAFDDEEYSNTVVFYALRDQHGNVLHGPAQLTAYQSEALETYDRNPVVATAPNGISAVAWEQTIYNATWQQNTNIFLALLDENGQVIFGPENITHNEQWGSSGENNVPVLSAPKLVATSANRFFLLWRQWTPVLSYDHVDNLYYEILDSAGMVLTPATQLTNDVPGNYDSGLFAGVGLLASDQIGIAYVQALGSTKDVFFTVLNEAGGTVYPITNISNNGEGYKEYGYPEVAQFSDGNVAIVWATRNGIPLMTIRSSTYAEQILPPMGFNHSAFQGKANDSLLDFSLVPQPNNQMVVTWGDAASDKQENHLYYGVFDSLGTLLAPPAISYTTQSLRLGSLNYGATSYTLGPTDTGVDTSITVPTSLLATPDGQLTLPIKFQNYGQTSATGVVVSATLPEGVSYLGDTSGILPAQTSAPALTGGQQLTWQIPAEMAFLGNGQFALQLSLSDAPIGTTFEVAVTITSAEGDVLPDNNAQTLTITLINQVFLPVIVR
jgi:uncharacterized repeat protein (TIGR01451 family)